MVVKDPWNDDSFAPDPEGWERLGVRVVTTPDWQTECSILSMRLAAGLILFASAWAAEPAQVDLQAFAGTWQENPEKSRFAPSTAAQTFTQEPDGSMTRVIGSGKPTRIHLDGKDSPVEGSPERTVAWTKVNDSTWEIRAKRKDQETGHTRFTLSDDGTRLTVDAYVKKDERDFHDLRGVFERTSGSGKTLIGTWKPISQQLWLSDLVFEATATGELRQIDGDKQLLYTAKPDGKEYPWVLPGDPAGGSVVLEPIGERSIRERVFRNRQQTGGSRTFTVSADGKTMTVRTEVPGRSDTSVVVYDKQ